MTDENWWETGVIVLLLIAVIFGPALIDRLADAL